MSQILMFGWRMFQFIISMFIRQSCHYLNKTLGLSSQKKKRKKKTTLSYSKILFSLKCNSINEHFNTFMHGLDGL